jgi:hypothetical protein
MLERRSTELRPNLTVDKDYAYEENINKCVICEHLSDLLCAEKDTIVLNYEITELHLSYLRVIRRNKSSEARFKILFGKSV